MNKFTSSGYVYGLDQNGVEILHTTSNFESDDYDDLLTQINQSFENESLNEEKGLRKFFGAIMYIESTTYDDDGKIKFVSNYVEFGELTETQSDIIYKQIFNEMFDGWDYPANEIL